MGSGYDDILSIQLTRNKTLSIGRESSERHYVRGGRIVSDFTCPSEIPKFNVFTLVSGKCWTTWNGHLLRPGGTSPPCFSFTRFIVEQCLLKKTNIWPLLTVWKLPGHHIVLNTADTRHTVMPWRIPFSAELFLIGIVCLLLWPIPSPQRSLGHSLFKQKFSQRFFFVLFCFLFCFFIYQNF